MVAEKDQSIANKSHREGSGWTQMVEWSLLTPKVCGSNPVIGTLSIVLKRRKYRKEAGYCPFKKQTRLTAQWRIDRENILSLL